MKNIIIGIVIGVFVVLGYGNIISDASRKNLQSRGINDLAKLALDGGTEAKAYLKQMAEDKSLSAHLQKDAQRAIKNINSTPQPDVSITYTEPPGTDKIRTTRKNGKKIIEYFDKNGKVLRRETYSQYGKLTNIEENPK